MIINVTVVKECIELEKEEKDYLELDKECTELVKGKKIKLLPGDLADPGDLYLKNPHRLTNFEIIDLFKNKPRFNGAYSRNRLQEKIKKEHM